MYHFNHFYADPQLATASFLSVPRLLFTHPHYGKLSSEAKILYALFLERGFDSEEKFTDDNNHSYIYYSTADMVKYLNVSRFKVGSALAELEEKNLIERVPESNTTKIYVKNFSSILSLLTEKEVPTHQDNIVPFSKLGGYLYE